MAIRSDNPVDQEIQRQQAAFEVFKRRVHILINSFKSLPPKERAQMIRDVQNGFKAMSQFFQKIKTQEVVNTGSKFTVENLKGAYSSLSALWRKFEKKLENESVGSGLVSSSAHTVPDPVDKVVNQFKEFMSKKGQAFSDKQLSEFRTQISATFEKIKNTTGKSSHSVQFDLQSGQLKIKIHSED